MKIAVYGASGYTGRLVAAELRRRGIDVVLSGRDEERLGAAANLAGLGEVEVRPADVDDRQALVAAFEMLTGEKLSYTGASWHTGERLARRTTVTFPGSTEETPVMNWPGCEVVSVPRHVRTRHVEVVINANAATAEFLQLLQSPPEVANKIIDGLPEGPDDEQRCTASFTIVAEAVGADGRRSRATVRGKDIYGCTAVIAVEGARSLVTRGQPAGVLSPAQAYDVAGFLRFLGPYGFSYTLEALEQAPPR